MIIADVTGLDPKTTDLVFKIVIWLAGIGGIILMLAKVADRFMPAKVSVAEFNEVKRIANEAKVSLAEFNDVKRIAAEDRERLNRMEQRFEQFRNEKDAAHEAQLDKVLEALRDRRSRR